jgi:hypothetical protein
MRFTFEPRLLDHLSVALYTRMDRAIAELVANSYDSDATLVEVTYKTHIIEIIDDGLGMSPADVDYAFLHIGRNRRDSAGEFSLGERPVLGTKGLGKLAGLAIARCMKIATVQNGQRTEVVIDRDALEHVESLEQYVIEPIITPVDPQDHGTTITLTRLSSDVGRITPKRLREALAREFPQLPDWTVTVNGVEATPEDFPGEHVAIVDHVPGRGNVCGFYVRLPTRYADVTPGFAVRVRGRIVQEASFFGVDEQKLGLQPLSRIVGELEPDFLDPVEEPTTHEGFVIKTDRSGLNTDLPEVQAFVKYVQRKLHTIVGQIHRDTVARLRQAAFERNPDLEVRLAALGASVNARLEEMIDSILIRLARHEDEQTVDEILDLVIRYYESDALRTLLESIRHSGESEVGRLAELLNEFGVARIADIADLVRAQLEVIALLTEKLGSGALEAEIHTIVSRNPWLIREGLTYWFDNRAFATELGDRLADTFTWAKKHRPDLVCYDDRHGSGEPTRLVIVEFKRPSVRVGPSELGQVMRYKAVFRRSLQQFRSEDIEIIIVGSAFDETFDTGALGPGYTMVSYLELLERAKARYQFIYDALSDARPQVGTTDAPARRDDHRGRTTVKLSDRSLVARLKKQGTLSADSE